MPRDASFRFLRAWLVTGVTDGLFASTLSALAYGSTVTRLWQGVASVLLGPAAFEGGARTAFVGVLMHFGVAFAWSAVFLALLSSVPPLRRAVGSAGGVAAVAAVYGPLIWIVMSFGVIPRLTGRPPTINVRWWVQCIGHIVFVALPIVASLGGGIRRAGRAA